MVAFRSFSLNRSDDKITINIFLLLGLTMLIILHLMCLYAVGLAIILAIIENIIVFYYLLKGYNKKALIYMCLFYTTNYGDPVFFGTSHKLDTIYYIENIPVFHGFLTLLSFFILWINVCSLKGTVKKSTSNILSEFVTYTFFAGVLMGLFTIIINGFQYRAVINDISKCIIPALVILVFIKVFRDDPLYARKYLSLVFHIILSYIIIAWITTTFGIYADFVQERQNVLMLPLPSFYLSSIILFLGLMHSFREKIIVFLAFLSTIYFQLFFDSCMNGKSWFVFVTTILVAIYLLARNSIKRSLLLYVTVFLILVVSIIKLAPQVDVFISNTENLKLLEFVSMFEAADSGDMDDMDQSSKARFVEFINVADQYIKEPIFALTGRGYGGSIHSNGFFVKRTESGYSADQYDSDKFYALHESVNILFLKFGLVGLFFFTLIIFRLIKGFKYSPWCYIGFIWLLFFWGYQNALLFIGVPAMISGLFSFPQNHKAITNTI